MNSDELTLARSFVIGDGSLKRVKTGAWLRIGHCEAQKEYLLFKAALIKGHAPMETYRKGPHTNHQIRWRTRPEFGPLYDAFYPGGKKKITPELVESFTDQDIMFWMADDGSLIKDDRAGFNANDVYRLSASIRVVDDFEAIREILSARYGRCRVSAENNTHCKGWGFTAEASQRVGALMLPLKDVLPTKMVRPLKNRKELYTHA